MLKNEEIKGLLEDQISIDRKKSMVKIATNILTEIFNEIINWKELSSDWKIEILYGIYKE